LLLNAVRSLPHYRRNFSGSIAYLYFQMNLGPPGVPWNGGIVVAANDWYCHSVYLPTWPGFASSIHFEFIDL